MLGEAAGVWMGELIYESAVIVNILGGSDQFPLHNLNVFVDDYWFYTVEASTPEPM